MVVYAWHHNINMHACACLSILVLIRCRALGDGRESARSVIEHAVAAVQEYSLSIYMYPVGLTMGYLSALLAGIWKRQYQQDHEEDCWHEIEADGALRP